MNLKDVTDSIEGFSNWSFADKIKFFGWYLHTYCKQDSFKSADIKGCFEKLNLAQPSLIAPFLTAMVKKNPKEALQNSSGFRLEMRVRQHFDNLYGQRAATVQVHKILSELPGRITTGDEQKYLEEVLTCFRHKAFRAAVVMCWN